MKRLEYDELLKIRASRELNERERRLLQEALAASPELRSQWEEDMALHTILRALPQPEISSNFTAQVLRKVKLETRVPAARPAWSLRPALARVLGYASLAAFLAAGGWHYHKVSERVELAESAAAVTTVARLAHPVASRQHPPMELPPMPPVDIWENFEAIRRLPVELDTELLLALE